MSGNVLRVAKLTLETIDRRAPNSKRCARQDGERAAGGATCARQPESRREQWTAREVNELEAIGIAQAQLLRKMSCGCAVRNPAGAVRIIHQTPTSKSGQFTALTCHYATWLLFTRRQSARVLAVHWLAPSCHWIWISISFGKLLSLLSMCANATVTKVCAIPWVLNNAIPTYRKVTEHCNCR